MVAVLVEENSYSPIAALTSAVDDLLSMTFTSLPARELPALARAVEEQLRRLPCFDHALIAEMDRRDVAGEVGARDTAKVLVDAVRISPTEAKLRVRAAADLGPRYGLTGEPLPALFPHIAAAQADGTISLTHARVITTTIDRLPHAVQAVHADAAEQVLVAQAAALTPDQLRVTARRLTDHLDPDGTLSDERDRARLRGFTLTPRPNGSAHGQFEFTDSCAAKWQAILDATSAPRPATDGVRDPRNAEQRRHDAMEAIADLLLRSGDLSDSGGTPATVIITMTLDQLEQRTGLATTSHGGHISIREALDIAAEAESSPPSSTTPAGSSATAGPAGSRPPANASCWPGVTAAARSRAATSRPPGARRIMSSPGKTAVTPLSATSRWSAVTITASSNNSAGRVR